MRCAKKETVLGGAGNVAKQIGNINSSVFLMTPSIPDDINNLLISNNITPINDMLSPEKFKVPHKKRIWANGQQICRVDDEPKAEYIDQFSYVLHQKEYATIALHNTNIINSIIKTKNIDVVFFIDYDKGALSDIIIDNIALFCKKYGVTTILDPKRPKFYNLKNLDIIKPNKKEANSTGMSEYEISKRLENTYLIVTEGKKGIVIYKEGRKYGEVIGRKVEVSDVCGAGDVAASIIGLLTGGKKLNYENVRYACEIANLCASKSVQHKGNYNISKEEFENIKGMIK